MPEIDFDDSLLVTQENLAVVDWDTLESFGLPSEGQHLAVIKKVGGYLHNFKDYTGPRAKLQMEIKEGQEKGKQVYDDINLPHPQEKDGNVKRRVLIASRLGLIPKGSKDATQVNWKLLEGKSVLVTVVHVKSDKDGKTYANVPFDGYEAPGAASTAGISQDDYADI
jgi:hypothetical protein